MNRLRTDYSSEVKLNRNRVLRTLLICAGTVSFILGIVGIFIPVLPTTPFLLLSAFCYARSSVRFYNWLLNNRVFGGYIRGWREQGSIPLKIKIVALTTLALTIGSSVIFFIPILAVKIVVALIGIAVAGYIIKTPTTK